MLAEWYFDYILELFTLYIYSLLQKSVLLSIGIWVFLLFRSCFTSYFLFSSLPLIKCRTNLMCSALPRLFNKMCLILQVIEISKGSKVKYKLDKDTGLIKVLAIGPINVDLMLFSVIVRYQTLLPSAGWPCSLLVSCVPTELWFHSSYYLQRRWPHGRVGRDEGL